MSRPSLSFDYVKKDFESNGYVLLSTQYVNNRLPLDFICPNGHKYRICWGN